MARGSTRGCWWFQIRIRVSCFGSEGWRPAALGVILVLATSSYPVLVGVGLSKHGVLSLISPYLDNAARAPFFSS